jgi:DNA-binding GntR family transcriptional regulator
VVVEGSATTARDQEVSGIRGGERMEATHRLARIPQPSLRDQVVQAVRDAIIQGKFRPGEKIPENDLAEQLGVSRTPIREAIRVLEQQGLVETRPKNGTYIAGLDREQVRHGLLVRAALEELAVRQALERLEPDEWDRLCDELAELLRGMRAAGKRGDAVGGTELDVRWHTLLIDAAANPYISRAWSVAGLSFLIWSPERELYPLAPEEWIELFDSRHQEVLAALRTADPDAAAEAVRRHILRKLDDVDRSAAPARTAEQPNARKDGVT